MDTTPALYHVAPADAADRIRVEGLRPDESDTEHARLRRHMRDLIDEAGGDIPDRHGAVYLWPSEGAAREYAKWLEGDHVTVIVDADAVAAPVWTTDSQTVEVLFETVLGEAQRSDCSAKEAVRASEECHALADEVVEYARPYNPDTDNRHREVWIPATVPAEAVVDVSLL